MKKIILSDMPLKSFWERVNITTAKDCWKWLGAKNAEGYGRFWVGTEKYAAHRVMATICYGEIPEGMYACHRCDTPGCVNPAHLFVGTPAKNARDKCDKGRHPRGEGHFRTHLTVQDILDIRRRAAAGERQRDLAVEYNMYPGNVSRIISRRRWGHIP